jgi:predicted DNA-binding transcriptional regulator AlpA
MITGWKSITANTGFSRNTLMKLIKEKRFPIRFIASKPTTTVQAIEQWFSSQIEDRKSVIK